MPYISSEEIDKIMVAAVINNTAQGVLHELRKMESNRAHVLTRWVWELLQNARDASIDSDTTLVASFEQDGEEVCFRHNGANFTVDQISHLIYHGSTKIENPDAFGEFGTGFLTTHLLSPEIDVSGWLDDGRHFQFLLKREISSVDNLSMSMDHARDDFKNSLSERSTVDEFTTQFRYPLNGEAVDAIEEGIASLKRCAPFVVAFNRQFAGISIEAHGEIVSFKVIERELFEDDEFQRVTVEETTNGNQRKRQHYLLAQGNEAAVATPLESTDDSTECLPVENIPRLFKGFPLIGTEDFSFPVVINGLNFYPTENRDGVYIGQSSDNEANLKNQAVIEEACRLLVELLQFTASSGWCNSHLLANIPAIPSPNWLNRDWMRDHLDRSLIEEIREVPVVLNEAGEAIHSDDLELPIADMDDGVVALWDLLDGWNGTRDSLPRRDEAAGWCDAAKSWARISGDDASSFDEVTDGKKLAELVQKTSHDPSANPTTHRVTRLNLKEGVEAINWLDQLIGFLNSNGMTDVIREYRIVPSQENFLRTLPNLHRDCGIPEELKDIAVLLDWRIRPALRDVRVSSLEADPGAGDWDAEYVVGEIIQKLQERAEKNPDNDFSTASVQLFSWLVGQEDYDRLHGFPVFTKELDSDKTTVIYLPRNNQDSEPPLAPVRAWQEDLRPFADLFPPTRILADDFFEDMPDSDVWQTLAEKSLVRSRVVMTSEVNIDKFYPDDPLGGDNANHRTDNPVTATDIVSRAAIMDRVRDSRDRARLFWRFLTEWLAKEANESLVIKQAKCECGETHNYYPSAWLESLRDVAWIRTRNDARVLATAQSLADLLRGQWNPGSLKDNPTAAKLLEAMGITHLDLVRAFGAANDEERKAQDDILAQILVATSGDVGCLNYAHQYIEDLKSDSELPSILAERREQRQRVHENQSLGKQVEDLVKASIKDAGFTVRRKPIGSDFEIEYDVVEHDEEVGIEVTGDNRTWLVEVKATRDQRVRMTERQAQTARQEGDKFLLCVVPLGPGASDPELDVVQANMRFVENIAHLVTPLCDNLDEFKDLREDITADEHSGVQLEVESGAIRVRVASSVWENEGFPIGDLLNRLIDS